MYPSELNNLHLQDVAPISTGQQRCQQKQEWHSAAHFHNQQATWWLVELVDPREPQPLSRQAGSPLHANLLCPTAKLLTLHPKRHTDDSPQAALVHDLRSAGLSAVGIHLSDSSPVRGCARASTRIAAGTDAQSRRWSGVLT